jgi:hypothetical protein
MFRVQEAENGGSSFLRDTGTHTLNYMASHPNLKEYYTMLFLIHCTFLVYKYFAYILDSIKHTNILLAYIHVWKVHSKWKEHRVCLS